MVLRIAQPLTENNVVLTALKVLINAGVPVAIPPRGACSVLEVAGCPVPRVLASDIPTWNFENLELDSLVEVWLKMDDDDEMQISMMGGKIIVASGKEVGDIVFAMIDILAEFDAAGHAQKLSVRSV